MLSHEEVHFRGQYYQQTGRQLNLAFAREIPAIGSVVAMELESRRRAADTFPTYMSFYLEKGAAGALSTGFLPPRFSVVDINPEAAVKGDGARPESHRTDGTALETALPAARCASAVALAAYGKEMAGYGDFYDTAHRLLTDERWPAAFQISRRGPQTLRQQSGRRLARFSRATCWRRTRARITSTSAIPAWDHHVQIWDRSAKSNHYMLCQEFDPALTSLMEDLSATHSKHDPSKTLLDETLVVVMSEFGRTPGALNNMAGRDHYNHCYPGAVRRRGRQARTDPGPDG